MTNATYRKYVEAGVCDSPDEINSVSYYGDVDYAEYPVIYVSWDDADTYCEWRGGRLPMEAECEKAARGEDGRVFPRGYELKSEVANFCDQDCEFDWANTAYKNGYADTAPMGSYPEGASPYGVMDLAGNVWEWVADWYDEDYYGSYSGKNPQGPSGGEYRVLRSGSWNDDVYLLRAANRFRFKY